MSTSGATGVLTVPDTFTAAVTFASSLISTQRIRATTTKTAAYNVGALDDVVLCDTTAAPFTVTLPTAVGVAGNTKTIKKISGANALTIASAGGTIDGAATITPLLNESHDFISDGTNWYIGAQAVATLI